MSVFPTLGDVTTLENIVPGLVDVFLTKEGLVGKCCPSGKSILASLSERKQLAIANPFWGVS